MTCIVGLVDGGKVYIGGDSLGADTSSFECTIRADEKVFVNGKFIMGFTTSFRMGQVLQYVFIPPDHDPRVNAFAYMVTTFMDALRKCLDGAGILTTENGVQECGNFLVGYDGHLYHVGPDFQVGESRAPYDAVGAGSSQALGAMFATDGMEPKARIEMALKAAERFCMGVRGPFVIKEL